MAQIQVFIIQLLHTQLVDCSRTAYVAIAFMTAKPTSGQWINDDAVSGAARHESYDMEYQQCSVQDEDMIRQHVHAICLSWAHEVPAATLAQWCHVTGLLTHPDQCRRLLAITSRAPVAVSAADTKARGEVGHHHWVVCEVRACAC